jgi:hypothetical protein
MRRLNVRYWHKADIALPLKNACFGGKADIAIDGPECPLMTQSGHWCCAARVELVCDRPQRAIAPVGQKIDSS